MPMPLPVNIIYHGHSNIEIHCGEHRVQVDPFYTHNGLADMKADRVTPNFILLTHAHFDHVEDAEAIARRTGATLASNYEITEYYAKRGIKVQGMNHGGGFDFPFGRATLTMAFHTSSFPDGTYGGQPGGWVIEIGGKTIYHAGDTALFGDMALIGRLWNIDLACLPIGDCFTMGPAHAVQAAEMLHAKQVLPIHYNTFPAIQQDPEAFVRELEKRTASRGVPLRPGRGIEL